ncbi:DUF5106 domain-containing protein [Sphingobacterium hungaricum]
MMKIRLVLLNLFIFCVLFSCQNDKKQSASTNQEANTAKAFTLPTIPENLTNEEDKKAYLLTHYWDNFDFQDTLTLNNPDITEQELVNFINLLNQVPFDVASTSITNLLTKSEANETSFFYFKTQLERYLFDPNSPMRNELFYEPVLQFYTQSSLLDETEKIKQGVILEMVRKNRPGSKATNFSYTLPSGKKETLWNSSSVPTLLFFYEPGCSSCERSIAEMNNLGLLNDLIKKNKLKILAVYALGDQSIWKDYQSSIPSNWVNAFNDNASILNEDSYDLKASPTIYILDADKNVVLKDVYLDEIIDYLNSNLI